MRSRLSSLLFYFVGTLSAAVLVALVFFILNAPEQAHRAHYRISLSLADGCLREGFGRVTHPVRIGGVGICAADRKHIEVDALVEQMRERLAANRAACLSHYGQPEAWLDRLTLNVTARKLDWVCGVPADKVQITLSKG